MKKYGEYTSIGLPWYPNGAPSHWKILRHKNVLTQHKELVGENSEKYTLLSLTLNGVIIRDLSEGKGKFSKDYDKYVVVNEGDFVFCLFDIDETPRTVGLSKHYGMITGAYDVFTPHDINSYYFFYYYLALDNNKLLKPLYTGLRKVIAYPTFTTIKFPVPPRYEQDQIVRYLDWQTSRINKLINGYKRQIELLEERKRTVTFYSVVYGLNHNIEMKDSIIPWIDHIPAHWSVKKLAQLFTQVKCKNTNLYEKNLLSLSYGKINRRNIDATGGLLPESFEGYNIIEKDDIVLRLTDLQNDHKSLRTGIATERGIVTSAYVTIRNFSENNPQYLHYYLHAFDLNKGFYNVGASGVRQSLNWDNIRTLQILLPPLNEQNQIVDYINRASTKIDEIKKTYEKKIELFLEYRTRLISDVVTGQIDVRDIDIPEYVSEEEYNDDLQDNNNDMEGDINE